VIPVSAFPPQVLTWAWLAGTISPADVGASSKVIGRKDQMEVGA